jgi:3-oxoacyl-[acyl-carrier protein] reductase
MDLGIAGRKALVCASSRGLGRACAHALAMAGCEVVINGRNRVAVDAAVAELTAASGTRVSGVVADVSDPAGQALLLAACPEPDILINNNGGPPLADFRSLTRQQMLDGVVANMVAAIELTQKVIDPMVHRQFGRIVNITSGTVKMPLAGLDLSSGARSGLTAFLSGIARTVAGSNVTINFILPGAFETDRLRATLQGSAGKQGVDYNVVATQRKSTIPARRFGDAQELGALCAFLCSSHAGFITGQSILIDGGAYSGTF